MRTPEAFHPKAKASKPAADIGVVQSSSGPSLHLLAGQLYFGSGALRVRTLLGSCVAITLWHPQRRIGGMCHFLLPRRPMGAQVPRDARFGEEAVEILAESIKRHGTRTQDYTAHLYGGADTLPDQTGVKFNIGERNIAFAWELVDHHGFQLDGVDVGETVPRTVDLDLATGSVSMKRGSAMK